ncbi:MAG: tRNA (adenosine(37)-N6)-dimethylallyltransferase MiaA [Mycoplasmoidaceae bacterium]
MKLIVIVGPTGSRKTEISYRIAKEFNFEIINSDAFQVYKELNLGINKPNDKILSEIKHHLINNVSVFDEWNIKLFKDQAEEIIDKSNKPIIICGGSNLYVHALLNNYNLLNAGRENIFDHLTVDELYSKLFDLDQKEAIKIGKNNKKSLTRALEIINSKKILKSDIQKSNNKIKYEYFILFSNPNREQLYEKINKRTEKMFDKNIIKEINNLDINKFKNTNASKAIGYKTLIENNLELNEEVLNKIKQESRNYAKRQVTWIRNKFNVDYETNNYEEDYNKILESIRKFLENKNV